MRATCSSEGLACPGPPPRPHPSSGPPSSGGVAWAPHGVAAEGRVDKRVLGSGPGRHLFWATVSTPSRLVAGPASVVNPVRQQGFGAAGGVGEGEDKRLTEADCLTERRHRRAGPGSSPCDLFVRLAGAQTSKSVFGLTSSVKGTARSRRARAVRLGLRSNIQNALPRR